MKEKEKKIYQKKQSLKVNFHLRKKRKEKKLGFIDKKRKNID
jgi:hypothetical protein